jgi:hypothetical protein
MSRTNISSDEMQQIKASLEDIKKGWVLPLEEYKAFDNAKDLEDELAARKMAKISQGNKRGKEKSFH